MFYFSIRVKDSPSFKITISSLMSGACDKFKFFVDCGCVTGSSCNSHFSGNYGKFDGFH